MQATCHPSLLISACLRFAAMDFHVADTGGSTADQQIVKEHFEQLGLVLFIDRNAHKVSAFQAANLLAKTMRESLDPGVRSSSSSDVVLSSEGGQSSPGSVSTVSSSDDDSKTSWSSASSVQQDSAGQTSNGSSDQSFYITSSDNAAHLSSSSYLMGRSNNSGQSTGDDSGSSIEDRQDVSSSHGNSDDELLSSAASDVSDIGSVTVASSSGSSVGSGDTGAHQESGDDPHGDSSSQMDELVSAIDPADSQDQDPTHASSSETGLNSDSSSVAASSSGIDSADETSSSSSIVSSSSALNKASSSAQGSLESAAHSSATSVRTEIESQSASATSDDEWLSSELTLTNSSSDNNGINISSAGFSSELSNNGSDGDMSSTMMVDSSALDDISSGYHSSGSGGTTNDGVGSLTSTSNETLPVSGYHIISSEDASDALSSHQQASDISDISGGVLSSTDVPSSSDSNGVSSFETSEESSMVRSNDMASSSSSDASENYLLGSSSSGGSNGLLTSAEESGDSSDGVSAAVSSNVDNALVSSSKSGTASSSQVVSSAENSDLQSADDDEETNDPSGGDLLATQSRAISPTSRSRQRSIQFNLLHESDDQAMIARSNRESIGVAGDFREEDPGVNLGETPVETDDAPPGTPVMHTYGGEAASTMKSGDQEFKFPIFFTVRLIFNISHQQMMGNGSPLTEASDDAFSWEYAKNLSIAVADLDLDPIVSVLVLRLSRTPDDGEPFSVIVDTLVRTTTSKGSRNLEDVLRQSPASLFPHTAHDAVVISNVKTNPADIIEWGNTELYSGVSNGADSEDAQQGTTHDDSTWQGTAAPLPSNDVSSSGGGNELLVNRGTPEPNKASATCRGEHHQQARDGTCCSWPMVLDKHRNCCDKNLLDECQVCGGNGEECTLMPHQGNLQHNGDINATSRVHHAAPSSELLPKRLAAPLAPGLRVMDLLAGNQLPVLTSSVANTVKPEKTPADIHNPVTAVHHVTPDGDGHECSNGAGAGCKVQPSTSGDPIGLDDSQARRQDYFAAACSGENCPDSYHHQRRSPTRDDGCPTGSLVDTAGDPAKSCTGNGVCSIITVSCSCHVGFAGSNCGQCAPHFIPFAGGCVPAALLSRMSSSSGGGTNNSVNGYYSTSGSLSSSWLRDGHDQKPDALGRHQDATSSSAETTSSSGRGRLREILKFRNLAIALVCIAASAAAFVAAAYAVLVEIRRSAEAEADYEHHHRASSSAGVEQHPQDLAYACPSGCATSGREAVGIVRIQMRSGAESPAAEVPSPSRV